MVSDDAVVSDEATASAFDWLTLDADEEVLWADTPHPYSLVPAFVVGVPLLLVLVGAVVIVSAYLTHTNTHYVVTSAALYKKTGVLSRTVQRIEFDKVQDTSYRQSVFGSQFGYGTVDVSTAGGGGVELRFDSVAEPQRLQTLINERIREREERSGSGREKAAVLDDIVTELRAIRRVLEGTDGEEGDSDGDDAASPDMDGDADGDGVGPDTAREDDRPATDGLDP
jgi:membrane protein YdbS with pleckstrin-like domain